MTEVKVLGDYHRTDRLWVVIPEWDEGEDWPAAEGTASLVVAPSEEAAKTSISADWKRVYEMPNRGSFDR